MKLLVVLAFCAVAVVFAEDEETFALKYLNQFQYISQSRSGNQNVETALKNFQKFAGIPETGRVDAATITQMKKPRCGLPDMDESGLRVRRYKTAAPWPKKALYYYIAYGRDLPRSTQDRVFYNAFKYWADVSGLSFSQVGRAEQADIKISFGSGTHHGTNAEGTCGYPFDGPGKVLAHAFFPSDGRAHFDEDERFTDGTSSGTNLLWVATHEFGHSLGLHHSDVRNAVMYPYYTGYVPNFRLQQDDINGIQAHYGVSSGSGGNGGGACSDKNTSCHLWKYLCGQHDYVIKNCKATCGTC